MQRREVSSTFDADTQSWFVPARLCDRSQNSTARLMNAAISPLVTPRVGQ